MSILLHLQTTLQVEQHHIAIEIPQSFKQPPLPQKNNSNNYNNYTTNTMAPITPYLQKLPQHEALSLIRQSLGLPPLSSSDETYNVKDAIIISIDFENVERLVADPDEPYLKTQMGVCILDTQKIGTSSTDKIFKTVCSSPYAKLMFPWI
jgi:hypothetical protein